MRIFAYLFLYMIFHGLIFRPDFSFLLNFIFLQEENVEDLVKKKKKLLKCLISLRIRTIIGNLCLRFSELTQNGF